MNKNEQSGCPSDPQSDCLTFIVISFIMVESSTRVYSELRLDIHVFIVILFTRVEIFFGMSAVIIANQICYSHSFCNFLCFSGNLLLRQGRRDEAMQSYESAIHYRPTLAVAYVNLALALHEAGLVSRAESVLVKCTQLDGSGLKDPRSHEAAKSSARQQLEKIRTEKAKMITTSEPSTAASETVSQSLLYEIVSYESSV